MDINLIEFLPPVLQDIREFKVVLDIVSEELNTLNFHKKDVLNQCFIDTATWGLSLWENRFAIRTDLNKSYEERRDIVRAKRRGYGTVTKDKLRLVSEAFTDGEVNVTEDSENYKFLLEFINATKKINLNGLYEVVEDIKPAHLDYNVAFNTSRDLNLETKVENYDVEYNLCGTIDCGVEPDIVTEGLIYIDTLDMKTDNISINEFYPISGEVEVGGEDL